MPTLNLRRVDRVAAYATIAASMSLQHAKLWPLHARGEDIGLVVGVARGAANSYEKYLQSVHGEQWDNASAVYFPNLVMSSVGGQVSAGLGIKGITSTLVGGTSAGMQALIHGWELFKRNPSQKAVVVLGADELAPLYFRLFDRLNQLAPTDGEGRSSSSPYDLASQGMVLGEGAGSLVLERAGDVRARGGKILATLRGAGLTQDATRFGDAEPTGKWYRRAGEIALEHAKLKTDDIDLVYGSGQGRVTYDTRENRVVSGLFGKRLTPRSLNHLTGVAEAASSLFHVIAATKELGLQENSAPDQRKRHAMITASGDDGTNAIVVLEGQS